MSLDKQQPYMVSIYDMKDKAGGLIFNFVPKGSMQATEHSGSPKRVHQYTVRVDETTEGMTFDWGGTQDDPGGDRANLEEEARRRVAARAEWIDRAGGLVAQVEAWGKELGWATRRIDKKLDDSYIGKHVVPALLMQQETCRVILEPVGRSGPGTEGIVDLYLLPAYDDIASISFYDGRWNVHYFFQGDPQMGDVLETGSLPCSKETLARVLDEMRANAA